MQFNATSYAVNEGEGSATISVTRIGNTSSAVTINYATSCGSAGTGTDYLPSSGTLQFAAGETIKTFAVPILEDARVEGGENINLILSGPSGGAFLGSPATATLTILDNDAAPILLTEQDTLRAIALDSVTMMREPFPLSNFDNFSTDTRTRIMFFASGLELLPGENVAAVSAQAEDNQHRIYPLAVEYVGKVPDFDWLSEIVVKLPDSIEVSGDFWISVSLHGGTSNKALIRIVK